MWSAFGLRWIRRAVAPMTFPLAVGLGGCGGGGSVSIVVGDDPDDDTPAVRLVLVASGFDSPVHVTHAGDGSGRLFVVERGGRVRIVRGGAVDATPFLDISARITSGGEQGLLSIAFPPDFAARRHFYVHYTSLQGVGNTVVARFSLAADDIADAASETELLTVVQPFRNHNGGQLAFGPDGMLYIGLGDGGGSGDPLGSGQELGTLLGKLLRIDVESGATPYAIPADNPFADEIWAYGLRNPWRFSFDRASGDLYIGDVGQGSAEEIDFQPAGTAGLNYGWSRMEGSACFRAATCEQGGLTQPVATYDHSAGDCSVTGGHVYRGSEFPALQGIYVYGDFCSGRMWSLRRDAGGEWRNELLLDSALQISSFGEDEAGNLYVADLDGGIYRIETR